LNAILHTCVWFAQNREAQMAKKVTKKSGGSPPRKAAQKKASRATPKRTSSKKRAAKPKARPETSMSAGEALVGLLESPLVADILAAGAAAALASFTHHSLSRRKEGGSAKALKDAAKAAGTAMSARLTEEFDEIIEAAKAKTKREGA
jgi:hypothetical protein